MAVGWEIEVLESCLILECFGIIYSYLLLDGVQIMLKTLHQRYSAVPNNLCVCVGGGGGGG